MYRVLARLFNKPVIEKNIEIFEKLKGKGGIFSKKEGTYFIFRGNTSLM